MKTIIGFILAGIGIILGCIIPFWYWIQNPKLTQMQVLINYWQYYLISFILVIVGSLLVQFNK